MSEEKPRCFGYLRVSTRAQAEEGESPEVQQKRIEAKYNAEFLPKGYAWGGLEYDGAVTASIPLRERERGKVLDASVRKGDIVLISRVDRGFRDMLDAIATAREWKARGVSVVFMDLGIDVSSDWGELILAIMAKTAEMERRTILERTMSAKRNMLERGLWPFRPDATPYGYKVEKRTVKNGGRSVRAAVLVPNLAQRQWGRYLIELFTRLETVSDTYRFLSDNKILFWDGKPTTYDRVYRTIINEQKLQADEVSRGVTPDQSLPPTVRWPERQRKGIFNSYWTAGGEEKTRGEEPV